MMSSAPAAAVTMNPFTATTAPPTSFTGRCTIDAVGEFQVDRMIESARGTLRQNMGLTDAQMDATLVDASRKIASLGTGGSGGMYGDLTKCSAVKTNRAIDATMAGVQAATIVTLVLIIRSRLQSRSLFRTLNVLTALGLALLGVQLRHAIALATKVSWWGLGHGTRGMLVLTALSVLSSVSWMLLKDLAGNKVLTALLLGTIGITIAKMYFTVRNIVQPEGMAVLAGTSALNRVLSVRKIKTVRNFLTGRYKPRGRQDTTTAPPAVTSAAPRM